MKNGQWKRTFQSEFPQCDFPVTDAVKNVKAEVKHGGEIKKKPGQQNRNDQEDGIGGFNVNYLGW